MSFRRDVDQLFEKLAWPFNPGQVAEQLRASGSAGTAADISSGQRTVDAVKSVGSMGRRAVETAGRGASALLAPAHVEGQALARELGSAGSSLMKQPALMRAGAGALLLAPIMAGAFHSTQQKNEDELMNARMNPGQSFGKIAQLDDFLFKKEAVREKLIPAIRGEMRSSFTEGLGKGVGGSVAQAILSTLGGGLKAIHTSLIVDPKRKAMFEQVTRTDPVVHDALNRNPQAEQILAEAFQTMVRFAPSLSLDVNAVRSFLREAVVGGSAGVNYATIKSLIETEKALNATSHRGF